MRRSVANLMESSIQIAWNYLDRGPEKPQIATRVLMDTVERMIHQGENRPLMFSNKAIDACKRFRKHSETTTPGFDFLVLIS
jgi:hypothetical protein